MNKVIYVVEIAVILVCLGLSSFPIGWISLYISAWPTIVIFDILAIFVLSVLIYELFVHNAFDSEVTPIKKSLLAKYIIIRVLYVAIFVALVIVIYNILPLNLGDYPFLNAFGSKNSFISLLVILPLLVVCFVFEWVFVYKNIVETNRTNFILIYFGLGISTLILLSTAILFFGVPLAPQDNRDLILAFVSHFSSLFMYEVIKTLQLISSLKIESKEETNIENN